MEVTISGVKLPFGGGRLYRVYVDGVKRDTIVLSEGDEFTAEEMIYIQEGYQQALGGNT